MRWLMMGYVEEDERAQSLEQAGHTVDVVPDGDPESWQSAGRTQYDGIWVHWAEVEHAIRPVVQYRSMRPVTRIVVEIPDELTPPDTELAQWVSLGIYDIVRSLTPTESVLRTSGTIADVLSWTGFQPVDHGDQAGEGQTAKPKSRRRKRTDPPAAQADTETPVLGLTGLPLTHEERQRLLAIDRSIELWLEKTPAERQAEVQAVRRERQRLAGIPQDVGPPAF